jgi:hypothetical protein
MSSLFLLRFSEQKMPKNCCALFYFGNNLALKNGDIFGSAKVGASSIII